MQIPKEDLEKDEIEALKIAAEDTIRQQDTNYEAKHGSLVTDAEIKAYAERKIANELSRYKFIREHNLHYNYTKAEGIKLENVSIVSRTITIILVLVPYDDRFFLEIKDYCKNKKLSLVTDINNKLLDNDSNFDKSKLLKSDKIKRTHIKRYLQNISRKKGGKYKAIRKSKKKNLKK